MIVSRSDAQMFSGPGGGQMLQAVQNDPSTYTQFKTDYVEDSASPSTVKTLDQDMTSLISGGSALLGETIGFDPVGSITGGIVDGIGGAFGGLFGGGGEEWKQEQRNYDSAPDNKVTVFQHSEYRGSFQSFASGTRVANLGELGFHDEISSIKVPKGLVVTVYANENFGGASRSFSHDVDFNDQAWNDRIDSLEVSGTPESQNVMDSIGDYFGGGSGVSGGTNQAGTTPNNQGIIKLAIGGGVVFALGKMLGWF